MESFEARQMKLTAELDAVAQSMQTMRTDMKNMSAEINRLTVIQLQRIAARADEELLRVNHEAAREFQVHLYSSLVNTATPSNVHTLSLSLLWYRKRLTWSILKKKKKKN